MSKKFSIRELVFRSYLENPSLGPSEMAKNISVKYNSVKAVFAKLCEDGLLNREGRGQYSPNLPKIILYLMKRIDVVEKGAK